MASVLILFAIGAVVMWNSMNQPATSTVAEQNPPAAPRESPRETPNQIQTPARPQEPQEFRAAVPESSPQRIQNYRAVQAGQRVKRQLSSVDFSSTRAEVIGSTDTAVVFPIDASLQPMRVSLDDGRGNARTISVPTISFGSQRTFTSGNAQKGSW